MQHALFRLISVFDTVCINNNRNFTVKKNLKRSLKKHLQIYYLEFIIIFWSANVMFQAVQG